MVFKLSVNSCFYFKFKEFFKVIAKIMPLFLGGDPDEMSPKVIKYTVSFGTAPEST
jgi:hypothetical protein